MKLSLPWGGNAIRQNALETGEEAARRAGLPFEDWLNSAILQQAEQATHEGAEQSAPAVPTPIESAPIELDSALAEIAVRQQELNAAPAPIAAPAQTAPSAPGASAARPGMQHLAGLEAQLRKITEQIETLRRPDVEQAIVAMNDELAQISGSVDQAMPRSALEAIERQILTLGERINEIKQGGVDARALAASESELAELKTALYSLTPAESLIGYREAIDGLAEKIDLIMAENDPATMRQLDTAIDTLRDTAAHVASKEIIERMSAQLQTLTDRIERLNRLGTAGDLLWTLEQRIDALGAAVQQRADRGDTVPPQLEALIASLADKIDRIQQEHPENIAITSLEDRIVQLMDRLDASDARLGHLEAIERGVTDLLVHIEEMRSWRQQEATEESTAVQSLREDVARTQDVLGAMQGTLGLVVDRLATIEHEIHAEREAPASTPAPRDETLELINSISAQALRSVSAARAAPAPIPAPRQIMSAGPSAEQEVQANQPLEPGSGPPLLANPATRIAPEAAGATRSSFIAAARRAAQAAQEADPRRGSFASDTASAAPQSNAKRRVKSVVIAASIVALVVGSAQIGGTMLGLDNLSKLAHKSTQLIGRDATVVKTEPAIVGDKSPATSPPIKLAEKTLEPLQDLGLSSPPSVGTDLMKPQATIAPPAAPADTDITGSIPQAKPTTEQLPPAIGGLWLRQAALAGDPAAAYEVGVRFAEGRGVPVNLEAAAHWFERAASKDLAPAQFRYASQLEKGLGVKKDLAAARNLYLSAAAKGNAKAMHNLAVLYAEGIDGKPDFKNALKWFQKAADHGVADSQYNLGILFARGIGVEPNMGEAYKWFALAAAQGDVEAGKKRDEVAGRLDTAALAAARQAVAGFKALPQPSAAITVPAPTGGWDRAAAASTTAPHLAAAFTMAK